MQIEINIGNETLPQSNKNKSFKFNIVVVSADSFYKEYNITSKYVVKLGITELEIYEHIIFSCKLLIRLYKRKLK